jgi:hypothetical protein
VAASTTDRIGGSDRIDSKGARTLGANRHS